MALHSYASFHTRLCTYAMMHSPMRTEAEHQEGGGGVDFVTVVDQALALLCQRGRLTYRTLQRQFQLDAAALEDLKEQLLYAYPLRSKCTWPITITNAIIRVSRTNSSSLHQTLGATAVR
jgi:hypothetical protein